MENFAQQRARLAGDPARPGYHFTPPANWLNDPNGLIQWRGRYHLFYQYNPNAPVWGSIHWGHALSDDLVHWEDRPVALTPTPDSADEGGCWSGCAVVDNGAPTLIYTGARHDHGIQRPCLATSADDDLITWAKHDANPVIPETPLGLDLIGFRDHTLWREGDYWMQGIGAGVRGVGGTVLLYRSKDLCQWDYLHPLLIEDGTDHNGLWLGTMWECPQFFALGAKHVLMFSAWEGGKGLYSVYMIGRYQDQHFYPETTHKLDFGDGYFYAPQMMVDEAGRTLLFGWVQEGRDIASQVAAGWSGVMSLPRVVSLHKDGTLCIQPAPELQTLRGQHWHFTDLALESGQTRLLEEVTGDQLEIIAEFAITSDSIVSLVVSEQTRIFYDAQTGQLGVETSQGIKAGALQVPAGQPLRLHTFIDHSVIEVFANDRACVTNRVYPIGQHPSLGIQITGGATLIQIAAWQLASIHDYGSGTISTATRTASVL